MQNWVRANSFFFLLFFALIVAYFPLLFSTEHFSPDASIILPYLNSRTSLAGYWNDLINLKTIDFQPVRDLSLGLDLMILKKFGLKTFLWHNLILWFSTILIVGRILKHIFPQITPTHIYVALGLFALHPVFNTTLNWSMARKHLLAFFFICLATESFLRSKRFKTGMWYLLSVLSQPISLLWPVWALYYSWIYRKADLKKEWKLWIFLLAIITTAATVNTLYYQSSPTFQGIYDSKTAFAFEFSDKILALGHYVFTLTWPIPAFYYDLGHWSTLAGLIIMGLFLYLCLGLRLDRKFLGSWVLFGLLPLLIVLNTPRLLSDTYLLIPALGLLIIVIALLKKIAWTIPLLIPALLAAGFIIINNIESRSWMDSLSFSQRNFERRPNCLSALALVRAQFSKEIVPTKEQKEFLKEYSCLTPQTKYQILEMMVISANLVYYNPQESFQEKIETLTTYSKIHYYADLILIALYIKEGSQVEAHELILKLAQRLHGKPIGTNSYDPIIAKVVLPYCQEKGFVTCENVAHAFSQETNELGL